MQPSNIETNAVINNVVADVGQYFQFADEFKNSLALDMFTIEDTQDGKYIENEKIINAVVSFNPPTSDETEHIKLKDDGQFSLNTYDTEENQNGVLLGTMSFQMTEEIFDTSWFRLIESSSSPTTGIKISVDTIYHYEEQKTFRFTDGINSDNAGLDNLIVSHGTIDSENPDNSTYKEYPLTPDFTSEITDYTMELMEYIDDIDITATLSDEASTMVIKVPKRDENNKLVYEEDGITIAYEEKTITNNVPINVILNELGEPDTVITIAVTTENGKTSKEYTLTIKRPYATIIGQAILANFDDESIVQDVLDNYGVQINNRVDINLYKPDLAEWESLTDIYQIGDYEEWLTYEKLDEIPKETTNISKDDGTFEIYVIPGKYDLQVTRLGYLDYIYSDIEINEGEIIDMEKFNMPAGDANRDSIISQEDMNMLKQLMDMPNTDPKFLESYNPSQLGAVSQEDINYAKTNQDKMITIKYFNKNE